MSNEAAIIKSVQWGKDLLNQLVVRKGIIMLKSTGKPALFNNIPDDTDVNVIPHKEAKLLIDEAMMFRNRAA